MLLVVVKKDYLLNGINKLNINKVKVLAILSSVIVLVVDQITKSMALQDLIYTRPLPIFTVIGEKLNFGANLFLTYNYGSAFSFIKAAHGVTFVALLLSSIVITSFLLYWLLKEDTNRLSIYSVGLIIGGAIGNIYDRVTLGYVIDFIDVYAGRMHWPVFNVADIAISVGVIILTWQILFYKDNAQ